MNRFPRFVFLLCFALAQTAWARPPVLERIHAEVARQAASGQLPVLVMDLDETTVDTTARKFQSYEDAVDLLCASARTPDCDKVAGLNILDFLSLANRYDIDSLLIGAGVSDTAWLATLSGTAIKTYLSGKWMQLDQAVPGAPSFVQEQRAAGAAVFFVSSRLDSAQREGTVASLQHLGLSPDGDLGYIFLRPDGMTSIDFKKATYQRILDWVSAHGAVIVGAFENEPENINAMVDAFPGAAHVFLTGAFLKAVPLKPGITTLRDFR